MSRTSCQQCMSSVIHAASLLFSRVHSVMSSVHFLSLLTHLIPCNISLYNVYDCTGFALSKSGWSQICDFVKMSRKEDNERSCEILISTLRNLI